MIKISIKKENDKIKKINITGHALYDSYGKDIVCSSVSSIVITTVNAILRIDSDAIKYDENVFSIDILKDNQIIDILIDNMLSLLKELEHDYPKNVKFI